MSHLLPHLLALQDQAYIAAKLKNLGVGGWIPITLVYNYLVIYYYHLTNCECVLYMLDGTFCDIEWLFVMMV